MPLSDSADALDRIIFPGGKPSRVVQERRQRKEPEPTVPGGWDSNPIIVTMKGQPTEFFRVAALAKALGKSTKTIYAWEAQKKIPGPRFRSAIKRDALKDKEAKGDRLYTRYQIEAAVAAAHKTGVISGKDTNWRQFAILVSEAWAQ